MRAKITELVFILDRSGSMSGLEGDTIGGFNSMLAKQKEESGEVIVTTVLFNDRYELLHDRTDIKGVRPITEKEYFVGGNTALLDAIGKTINKISNAQKHICDEQRANKVLFVIITDGMENSSREFSYDKIKGMIETQKKAHDWEFLFLGANIDAISEAAKIGIGANRAVNYHADSQGTMQNFKTLSNVVTCMQVSNGIPDDWKKDIEDDFENRINRNSDKRGNRQ